MFIGHFGVGFAARKIDTRPSLGTLLMASQFIDLLWPFLLLLGIEHVVIEPGNTAFTPLNFIYYPFSHGLISVIFWGVVFGGIYYLLRKNWRSAFILGLLVISHWVLDFLTHRPDLPLAPGLEWYAGLGLWNHIVWAVGIELFIFTLGVYFYWTWYRKQFSHRKWRYWSLVVFLLIVYFMNFFGDPPPSEQAIGYVGLAQWLMIAWGYWIDRPLQMQTTAPVSTD